MRTATRAKARPVDVECLDESLPPDIPPGFAPPGPRPPITPADLPGRLVTRLRRDYAPGRVTTDDGRRLGDLPVVRAWLATLPRTPEVASCPS